MSVRFLKNKNSAQNKMTEEKCPTDPVESSCSVGDIRFLHRVASNDSQGMFMIVSFWPCRQVCERSLDPNIRSVSSLRCLTSSFFNVEKTGNRPCRICRFASSEAKWLTVSRERAECVGHVIQAGRLGQVSHMPTIRSHSTES